MRDWETKSEPDSSQKKGEPGPALGSFPASCASWPLAEIDEAKEVGTERTMLNAEASAAPEASTKSPQVGPEAPQREGS